MYEMPPSTRDATTKNQPWNSETNIHVRENASLIFIADREQGFTVKKGDGD